MGNQDARIHSTDTLSKTLEDNVQNKLQIHNIYVISASSKIIRLKPLLKNLLLAEVQPNWGGFGHWCSILFSVDRAADTSRDEQHFVFCK